MRDEVPYRGFGSVVCGLLLAGTAAFGQPLDSDGYLELDGVDDTVVAQGDFALTEITVEAWIRPRSVHPLFTAGIVSYGGRDLSSFNFGIGPETDPTLVFFINYNQGQQTIVGNRPVSFDRWQHVAVTYDGQIARLYIDGALDLETPLDGPILESGPGAILAIGDDYPGASEFVGGSFDEVRIWNVVRSAQEINDSMMMSLEGDEPGLYAYYDFEACAGQVGVDIAGSRHASLGGSLSRAGDDPERVRATVSRRRCLALTSSDAMLEHRPVVGTIDEQVGQINAGPPALGWEVVTNRHADLHVRDAFMCDPDLSLPYVDADTYLVGVDEATLDNCSSAFYRVVFEMPPAFGEVELFGAVNADDLGVVYLGGVPVSPRLTLDDVSAVGEDRVEDGRRLVGWPTADPVVEMLGAPLLVGGENELVIGVCSDASETEPAGVEFELYLEFECFADWDADGTIDTEDTTAYLNDWATDDPGADIDASGRVDIVDIMLWLNAWRAGCPE